MFEDAIEKITGLAKEVSDLRLRVTDLEKSVPPVPSFTPELTDGPLIESDLHTFTWVTHPDWQFNLEIGTHREGDGLRNNIFWQREPIEDGFHIQLFGQPPNTIYVRLWFKEGDKNWDYKIYEYTHINAMVPPVTDKSAPQAPEIEFTGEWPLDARKVNFKTTYTDLVGYDLMKQGVNFVKNFRYKFNAFGRTVSVKNQKEFDDARNNGDIGVIRFVSNKPVVLMDRRRSHNSVQLLTCDTLSHVRTWGNIAISCKTVSAPQGGGANVHAHGPNVLHSKSTAMSVQHTWADITVEAPSSALISNVVSQGGHRKGKFSAGAERVSTGVAAWTGNWQQYWDDPNSARDFDINTDGVGIQGMHEEDMGADGNQDLDMVDWTNPAKSNHPHGVITNKNGFAIGCLSGVTKAMWDPALGESEQFVDKKAAEFFLMRDCVTSGFLVNKVKSNSSWGGGLLSTHWNVNNTKTLRCIAANQHRHVEIGSGDKNLFEECLFGDTQAMHDYVTSKGHNSGGQWDIAAYREKAHRYPWCRHGHSTAVQTKGNVFDHAPRHSALVAREGEVIVDPKFNVYKKFGALGDIWIGTRDPKAKGSIWYAE